MNWTRVRRFAVRSRNIVTPSASIDGAVIVDCGRIEAVGPSSIINAGLPTYDVGDLTLLPGLTDTHVHINEPGRTEWEGYDSATHAAAAGGITCVVDMPLNCIPVTTSLAAFHEKTAAIGKQLHVDCAYYGGVIPGNINELKDMVAAGVVGFKAFMVHSGIDDFPKSSPDNMRNAMRVLRGLGVPLLVHAELDETDGTAVYAEHPLPEPYTSYLRSRPDSWEINAIRTVIALSEAERCRTHVVHLSAAGAVPDIVAARGKGVPISVETCPHYLTFAAEKIADGDTRFKCAPPVREKSNQDKLWRHLGSDEIDFVVSDHSPCAPHLKLCEKGDFEHAWGGIAGLQFGLPAVWTGARERGYTMAQLANWMCCAPASLVGLAHRKGKIAPGYDADLVAFDPEKRSVPGQGIIYHKHKVTPYADVEMRGHVEATFVRGNLVFERGAFPIENSGSSLLKGRC